MIGFWGCEVLYCTERETAVLPNRHQTDLLVVANQNLLETNFEFHSMLGLILDQRNS